MSIVHCKLPRSGLGNQLFPLLKAVTFGHLNELPVIITGYHQFRIGPYLRREKTKRRYNNYFVFEKNLLSAWFDSFRLSIRNKNTIVKEPPVRILLADAEKKNYEFGEIPHWDNFFDQLKENREIVLKLFEDILQPAIRMKVSEQQAPCIGVHVRMGDFRKLQQGEDFKKVGSVRTPEEYFINIIRQIREIHGSSLPVSVFTDGYRSELKDLLSLENVMMVEGNRDIVDMLLLSRSKIIVASSGSTFSYWSGFLANAPLLLHPDHIHQSIRPDVVNNHFYEGGLVEGKVNGLLEKNIKSIVW